MIVASLGIGVFSEGIPHRTDKEVETINAWALERVTQKEMEAEQFQLFSQVVTQVWQAMDRRHARQR